MDQRAPTAPARHRGHRLRSTTALGLLAACGACAFLASPTALADGSDPGTREREARIVVAYVYNFPKFIEWPDEELKEIAESIRLCVIGTDPIGAKLDELSRRAIRGRPIEVEHLKDADAHIGCHVLFITRSEEQRLPSLLRRVGGAPVLTVSDIPQFVKKGGMIGFFTEDDRVRIEIDARHVRQAGLRLSAKVLEIARIVS